MMENNIHRQNMHLNTCEADASFSAKNPSHTCLFSSVSFQSLPRSWTSPQMSPWMRGAAWPCCVSLSADRSPRWRGDTCQSRVRHFPGGSFQSWYSEALLLKHNRTWGVRKQCCVCSAVMEEQGDHIHLSLEFRRIYREHLLTHFPRPFLDLP